jgi:hypothetical protein
LVHPIKNRQVVSGDLSVLYWVIPRLLCIRQYRQQINLDLCFAFACQTGLENEAADIFVHGDGLHTAIHVFSVYDHRATLLLFGGEGQVFQHLFHESM